MHNAITGKNKQLVSFIPEVKFDMKFIPQQLVPKQCDHLQGANTAQTTKAFSWFTSFQGVLGHC